jgi:hypothetical protein
MGMRRRLLSAALGFSLALGTLLAVAQPVGAARILVDCTGTCGYYELYDEQTGKKGANCLYKSASPGELDAITVRPPLMHGNYPTKTKVEWRFRIRHKSSGGIDPFVKIYTSSWQSALADDAIPAYPGHGFSRRAWNAPSSPAGFYQVVVELRWWHQGAKEGFVRAQYEWYKAKRNGASYVNNEYCLPQY